MPYIWIDYGPFNVISPHVYMKLEDCITAIKERVAKNEDDFPYKNMWELDVECGDEAGSMTVWGTYRGKNYKYELQIHYVDIK